MPDPVDAGSGQRRVLWRREVHETLDDTSIRLIRERTGIEMPDAFPAVVIAIRHFLSSPMRTVAIETEAALSWQAGGPWRAPPSDVIRTGGDSDT